jgi:hypothetical protein
MTSEKEPSRSGATSTESRTRPVRIGPAAQARAYDTDAWKSVDTESAIMQFELEVRTRLARMASESRFALMGLHWSAYRNVIEKTYQAERARFDTAAVPLPILVKYATDLAAYRKALDSAWMLLENEPTRRAHRDWLIGAVDDTEAADMYLRRAKAAVARADRRAASDALLRVLELEPGNTGARALGVRLRQLHR